MSDRRNGPMWVYVSLAVIGLLGTAWFNVQGFRQSQGNVLGAWFANPATSSLSIDLLVTARAASIFMVLEGRRVGVRWYWLYVLAAFVTAVGFTFPLFLAARERRLNRSQ